MKKSKIVLLLSVFLLLISCKKTTKNKNDKSTTKTLINFAQNFAIDDFKDYKTLTIKEPYKDSKSVIKYYLVNDKTDLSQFASDDKIIKVPLKNCVVTSTTHIPMLELLNVHEQLVGFPNTRYVSSPRTRKLIDEGKIKELGMDASLNTEVLLELNPSAVIGFSVSGANKSLNLVEKSGIPVIYNGDWLEEHPLGRAEWIKFFGVLFGKEKESFEAFSRIEDDYNQARVIANMTSKKPTILSGAMFKDVWNLPAGDSFVARFLNDANTDYLWSETTGKGSLQLSLETVLEKGQNADVWIAPGYFETKEQLLNASKHYKQFKAFENGEIYTFSNKKGETGGVLYYELAPTRPDLVLKDIIKITHPETLNHYELTFFEKMN